ncbi:MAG TPA: hypothetical protein DCS93_08985 [Microscillaceae bacterium]|nr:hypothetical protein [Microscillaceae bacterium]
MKQEFKHQIYYTLLIIVSFTLPFDQKYSSFCVILLGVWHIVTFQIVNIKKYISNTYFLLLSSLFIALMASLLYTKDLDNGFFNLEKYLGLIIFPIIIFSGPPIPKSVFNKILNSFLASCFIACLFCLIYAFSRNLLFNNLSSIVGRYYGTNLTNILDTSHVYLGIYLLFCLAILYHKLSQKLTVANILLFLYFVALLVLNAAKMAIIALTLLSIFNITVSTAKPLFKIGILASILTITSLLIIFTPTFSRFERLLKQENFASGDNYYDDIGVRVSILKCTIESYTRTPLLIGNGIGDGQNTLDKTYEKNGYLSLSRMNSHNQYLYFIITIGLIGLVVFVKTLVYLFEKAWKDKNILYINLILIIALSALTEAILESNKGIIFYSFFQSLFAFHFFCAPNNKPAEKNVSQLLPPKLVLNSVFLVMFVGIIVVQMYPKFLFIYRQHQAFQPLQMTHQEMIEKRIADFKKIKIALEKYKKINKNYPVSGWSAVKCSFGTSRREWIPGLAPEFIDVLPVDPRYSNQPDQHYIYFSNGRDYKVFASLTQKDIPYIKKHYPQLIDPTRPSYAYGIWSNLGKNF